MIRLIGVLGAKGCGKDTLAKLLIAKLGFVRVSFADALYREVAGAYGVAVAFLENRSTKETPLPELALANCKDRDFVKVALRTIHSKRSPLGKLLSPLLRARDLQAPRSPRWVMQLWGTEYRRESEFGWDSYWIDKVESVLQGSPEARHVITDVRLLNEARMVRRHQGALVRVRRPALEQQEAQARAQRAGTALHSSETQLAAYPVDFEVTNREGRPEQLGSSLVAVLPELADAA